METMGTYTGNVPITDQARSQVDRAEGGASSGRHRPTQLPRRRDFFVPVSQREKPSKSDIPADVTAVPSDEKPKKKRGRSRKRPLDDGAGEDAAQIPIPPQLKKRASRDDSGASGKTSLAVSEDRKEDPHNSTTIFPKNTLEPVGAVLGDRQEHTAVTADEPDLDLRDFKTVAMEKGGRHPSAFLEADELTSAAGCSEAVTVKSGTNNCILRTPEGSGRSAGRPAKANRRSSRKTTQEKAGVSKSPEVGDHATEVANEPLTPLTAASLQQEESLHLHWGAAGMDTVRDKTTAVGRGDLPVEGPPLAKDGRNMDNETHVKDNGQDEAEKHQLSGDSRDDFFIPVSKRRKRNSQLKEVTACEVKKSETKLQLKTDEQAAQMVGSKVASLPDYRGPHFLRLEAVLAAEENARLYAGRATHPFFSRKKSSVPKTVVQDRESNFQFEDLQPGAPIHVTQSDATRDSDKVDEVADVTFMGSSGSPCRHTENYMLDSLDSKGPTRLLQPLVFPQSKEDPNYHTNALSFSRLTESSAEDTARTVDPSFDVASTLKALLQRLESMQARKIDWKFTESGALAKTQPCDGVQTAGMDLSLESLNQKLSWYITRHRSQIIPGNDSTIPACPNMLWTDLYQPKTSKEVCGNADAVGWLRSWLFNWQQRITGHYTIEKSAHEQSSASSDSDGDWFEDGIDSETEPEEDGGVPNTLLICGPEGCGKSASIYACAAEQGFEVIEVNASDHRHGSLIKSKFGEAMKSHTLGKSRQPAADSPQSVRGRGHIKQGPASKETTIVRQATAGKQTAGSCNESNQGQSSLHKEDTAVDFQKKGRTLILFEDADKRFDEDKGLLPALVELANRTRRPIILTSNRREPGLPAALEKCKIQFSLPALDELVLHAALVCTAEHVPCSIPVVESLVHSCQMDLRKVMVALQFWGQGNESSKQSSVAYEPGELTGKSDVLGEFQPRDLVGTQEKAHSVLEPSETSDMYDHVKGLLDHSSGCIRWLFELDVHHLLLPRISVNNNACPLSVYVAEKIYRVVCKLENDTAEDAARKAEARASKQEAELAVSELLRKAERKQRRAARAATPSKATVTEQSLSDSYTTPIAGEKRGDDCGATYSSTPSTGIRGARAIARSRVKRNALKARRAILLDESDDEAPQKQQPAKGGDIINRTISDSGTVLPLARQISSQTPNNTAEEVDENLDEIDPAGSGNSVVEDGKTLSIRQGAIPEVGGTPTGGVGLPNTFSGLHPVHSAERCEISTVSEGSILFDERMIRGDALEAGSQSEHLKTVLGIAVEDNSGSHAIADETNRLLFDTSRCSPSHSEATLNIGYSNLSKKEMLCIGKQIVDQPAGNEIVRPSEMPTFDSRTQFLDVEEALSQSPPLANRGSIEDATLTSQEVSRNLPVVGQSEDVQIENQDYREESTCAERREYDTEPGNPVNEVDSLVTDADERAVYDRPNPVSKAWQSLRECQKSEFAAMMDDQTRLSADAICDLADLVDVISASDVMAGVQTEELTDSCGRVNRSGFATFEDDAGRLFDREGCREKASHLVFLRLQHSLRLVRPSKDLGRGRISVLACILESAKDPPAVGKCLVDKSSQTTCLDKAIGDFDRLCPARQAHIEARLEALVDPALRPKRRISSSALIDYSTCLSRISQLEEARKAEETVADARRLKRFEHYLTSRLQSFPEEYIPELLMCTTYGKF